MLSSVHIKEAVDILNVFFETMKPFDVISHHFFKQRKYIGSTDRRSISEFLYSIFRKYEKIHCFTKDITCNFGKYFIMAFLKSENLCDDNTIFKILRCNDSESDKKFLEKIHILSSEKIIDNNVLCNYPKWLEPFLYKRFEDIENIKKEMLSLNEKANLDLRINTLKAEKNHVKQTLINSGFEVKDTLYSENCIRIINTRITKTHEIILNGLAEIQDEGSQVIAEICDVKPSHIVVDYCAGAGGKTLALAAKMQNKGKIFALDKYEYRLENAKLRFKKSGVHNVSCHEINNKWIKRHLECADVLLIDAPCSGTGTWRRNPDMRVRFQKKDLEEIIALQQEILTSAEKLLKPGGILVYATCSFLCEENEEQIERFLKEHKNFALEMINIKQYNGQYLKLSPYTTNTDGFFAAKLRKNHFL